MSAYRFLAALALFVFAGAASAHTGHGTTGFSAGFAHPFSGIDHLLAMLAVGVYAAQQQGAVRWALPAGFVAAMLGGAALGAAGMQLPLVETGISVSVLVLGLLIAFVVRLPLAAALPLVAAFAVFHGFAHHAEKGSASMLVFAAGFAAATASLHGAGYVLAKWVPETRFAMMCKRVVGTLIAASGLVLLGS
ncbi:HupE/UreJ family protein [Azoarcus sp. L1K30]|uniref:HupE/UreJ family protein n=1 Tax=Azoarcus sp. L1K30 TaxID=2820277 RepID=UPI001B817392|nr:HupE/UreJ family protein [Azoarcus sp. L1K30]MBR0568876.1 HupE/UreJ family protein [Azoarcus sp. L1K30]